MSDYDLREYYQKKSSRIASIYSYDKIKKDNIDFFNHELSVVKNVVQEGESGDYIVTTPKTRTSVRTLPVPERVMNDLHELYLQEKKQYGFSLKWFVFGDKEPLSAHILRHNKNKFTEEG